MAGKKTGESAPADCWLDEVEPDEEPTGDRPDDNGARLGGAQKVSD